MVALWHSGLPLHLVAPHHRRRHHHPLMAEGHSVSADVVGEVFFARVKKNLFSCHREWVDRVH